MVPECLLPSLAGQPREGDADWVLIGSSVCAGQLATARQGPAGHEPLTYNIGIIPAGCGARELQPHGATAMAEKVAWGFVANGSE